MAGLLTTVMAAFPGSRILTCSHCAGSTLLTHLPDRDAYRCPRGHITTRFAIVNRKK